MTGALSEWLWRGRALTEARALPELAKHARQARARAELTAEFAARVLDPIEPLRAGPAHALALSLYREAAYYALVAHAGDSPVRGVAEAFDAARASALAAAGGAELLAHLRDSLLRAPAESALLPPEQLEREARAAKAFVQALIAAATDRHMRSDRLLTERWLRTGVAAAVLLVLAASAAGPLQRAFAPPDLAAGKPWRTSSKGDDCEPGLKRCMGARTAIFFHTKREHDPWFEVDLGAPTSFAAVEVVNRRDCCQDRVVPLVVEVSNDQKSWSAVARRVDTFPEIYRAVFAKQRARYVRLRVDRRSTLFAERVSVYAE